MTQEFRWVVISSTGWAAGACPSTPVNLARSPLFTLSGDGARHFSILINGANL